MNQKELKELIEFLIEKDIAEFELERGDVKVRIKRGGEHVVSVAAPAPILPCTRRRLLHPELGARRRSSRRSSRRERRSRLREEGLHIGALADRGNFLRVAVAGIAAVCEARRHGRSRAGAVHRRSHEVDERDRVGRGRRDREEAGRPTVSPSSTGRNCL